MSELWSGLKIVNVKTRLVTAFLVFTIVPLVISWVLVHDNFQEAMQNRAALLAACVCVVLVGILAVRVANSVVKPIRELSKATNELAKGDLSITYEVTGEGEIGKLADGLTTLIGTLGFILVRVKEAAKEISVVSSQILAGSEEQAASATQQSSAISQTTASAQELSLSAEQITENIGMVTETANHSLAGMAKIKESTQNTGERTASLSEKSQQIGKITELIDDVADQTNLLAVNAAIEAARAGEQGRGFTVVADEIRKLADSTAKSTQDITSLIEIIQREVAAADTSMQESMRSVEEEVQLAEESARKAKEISMSSTQQMGASRQIAEAMSGINEAMKQGAEVSVQSSESATRLTELASQLKDVAETYSL